MRGGVTMPAKGKLVEREYAPEESGAGLPACLLGGSAFDAAPGFPQARRLV